MIAWAVLAVGAVYPWAAAPLIAATALAALLAPAAPLTPPDSRALDWLLIASLAAALSQLVPLPPAVHAALSPNADSIPAALVLVPIDKAAWRPLSVTPASTAYAIGLVLTAVLFFWVARQCCSRGQARRIVDGIAFTGLVVALVAIVLRSVVHNSLIYGRWHALDKGAHPFGPFVNRDHFATWIVMACPLAAGGVAASLRRLRVAPGPAGILLAAFQWLGSSAAWVGAAGIVMVVALVMSTSRSGIIALGASLVTGAWLARTRLNRRTGAIALLILLASAAIVAAYANAQPLLGRLQEAVYGGVGGRREAWAETVRIVRDFPLTGTGLGSYRTVMLVYQQSNRDILINQAHNQYLHLFAEGGLLLSVPALLAALAFIRLFRLRMAQDTTSSAWLRIGGGVAMVAAAVQGLWETGLRIPANGLLFAAAAAVAIHAPPARTTRGAANEPQPMRNALRSRPAAAAGAGDR
jgi:O-antigen ligase